MLRYLFTAVAIGTVALMLAPARLASADWILIDDFNDGDDEGWTPDDNLTTAGPRIVDAASGAYHLQSTGPTNTSGESSVWSIWDASADPVYSEGFVRVKVRSDSTGGVVGPGLRVSPDAPPWFLYFFVGNAYTGEFLIARDDERFGSYEEHPLPGARFRHGEDWIIEGGIVGDLLSMKVWRDGEPEPGKPQLTWRDPNPLPNGLWGVQEFIDVRSVPVRVDGTVDDIYFHPPVSGDFNSDRRLDVEDIDLLTDELTRPTPRYRPQFDLNEDDTIDLADHEIWVHERRKTWYGDVNLDLEFNTGDLVQVLGAGKYETQQSASWCEGDWNGDGVFGTEDLVKALEDGGYEKGLRTDAAIAPTVVPEPTSILLLMIGLIAATACRRWP